MYIHVHVIIHVHVHTCNYTCTCMYTIYHIFSTSGVYCQDDYKLTDPLVLILLPTTSDLISSLPSTLQDNIDKHVSLRYEDMCTCT